MSIANIEMFINENLSTDHTLSSADDQPSDQPDNDPNLWANPFKSYIKTLSNPKTFPQYFVPI